MFCSNCGKEINDDVKFCAFCGDRLKTEKEKDSKGTKIIFIIFAIIFIIIFSNFILNLLEEKDENPKETKQPECPSMPEMEEALNLYQSGKIIISINPQLNAVYVSPKAQLNLNYENMKTLGYICACYSSEVKGTGLIWVEIFDSRTHKKIAKFSQSQGLKMY